MMTNLAEAVHENSTIAAIDRAYEANRVQRRRLGLSEAGHSCSRFLWYKHRGYDEKPIDGRVLRLFQLGNILEEQMITDLRSAGFQVYGEQEKVEIEMNGITLFGSIDGRVEGLIESPKTTHLFECKSASKKRFDELVKLKNYRKFNETYYWQVQFYMIGLGLTRAAVFVYCKDDSRLYMERIRLDKDATVDRLRDVFRAISMSRKPNRNCDSYDCFESRFCTFQEVCWR